MQITPFKLERYFDKYEFKAPYLLSCSDCQPLALSELLELADDESRQLWNSLSLGYTHSQGHPLLRQEIANLYMNIKPDDTLVVAPQEGIFIAMNVLLQKEDHVIVTYPGYQSLYEIARTIGCDITKWEPIEQEGWKFDIEFLKSQIKPNTKLIVINFSHNPTGATVSKQTLQEIIELAREHNIFVFSDEMYRLLEYDEKDRLPSASDLYDNAISLFGMSKSFGLAGLRIGWLTTQNKTLMDRLAAFKDYTTICSSAPSEVLALMALRARQKIVVRNLAIIDKNLRLLDNFFEKHSDIFSWHRPNVGPITFPKLLLPQKVDEFCAQAVQKQGVMVLPATVYDYSANNFRVGFGRTDFPLALAQFEQFITQLS